MANMQLFAVIAMGMTLSMAAEARDGRRGPPAPEARAAFEACAAEAGITLNPGERPRLSDAQRESFGACLKGKGVEMPVRHEGRRGPPLAGREKMRACLEAAGVSLPKPAAGERPVLDDATKAAMDKCRAQVSDKGAAESSNSGVSSAQ